MAKVAINGLGRIGRATLKIVLETPELELAAVNDLGSVENIAYLLRYDSVYGRFERSVEVDGDHLVIDGKRYRVFNEKDPAALPWRDLGIDTVFECTGHFTKREGMEKHRQAGARTVILSAPVKDGDIPTIIYGVSEIPASLDLLSCASCTTNSVAPVMEVLDRRFGVEKAFMTTLHAYTASQSLVDGPNKKFRRGRAAAVNFVPSSTGAATATTRALPQLEGKFSATAVRGPVAIGSISEIVALLSRPTNVEELNGVFRDEAAGDRYRRVMSANADELVSSDVIRDPHASIVDLTQTSVIGGNLVKVMTWYDNEWGYSSQMVRTAAELARRKQTAGV